MPNLPNLFGRWMALVAGIFLQISCGVSYNFAMFSPFLKSHLHFSEDNLHTVAFAKDLGASLGIFAGMLYYSVLAARRTAPQSFKARFGVHFLYAFGAIIACISYLLLWMCFIGRIHSKVLVHILMWSVGNSQAFVNTANIMLAIRNFQDRRATAVGIIQAYFGLSGSILIEINSTFFHGNPNTYILSLAIAPVVACSIFLAFIRLDPRNASDNTTLRYFWWCGLLSVVVLIGSKIAINEVHNVPTWVRIAASVCYLILILLPIAVGFCGQTQDVMLEAQVINNDANDDDVGTVGFAICTCEEECSCQQIINCFFPSIRTLNFWLLFLGTACTMGAALSMINHMSNLGHSVGYNDLKIKNIITMWNGFCFVGCFVGGFASDCLGNMGFGRPWFLGFSQFFMLVGFLICNYWSLMIGSGVIAVCYGAVQGLLPVISHDVFGENTLATDISNIYISSPLASFALTFVVKINIRAQMLIKDGHCGRSCFSRTYVVLGICCVCGAVLTFWLAYRTRGLYNAMQETQAEQQQHGEGEGEQQQPGEGEGEQA